MDIITAIQANLLSPAVLVFALGLIAAQQNLPQALVRYWAMK